MQRTVPQAAKKRRFDEIISKNQVQLGAAAMMPEAADIFEKVSDGADGANVVDLEAEDFQAPPTNFDSGLR